MDNPKKYFTGANYWIILPRILIRGLPLHSEIMMCRLFYDVHIDLLMDCLFYMDTYGVSIRVKPFCIDFITFSTNVY